MQYLAHSARPDRGIPAQEYGEHIRASRELANVYAKSCGQYSPTYRNTLLVTATLAGEYHDLGKLDSANQQVLAGLACGKLPVPHVDSGVVHLLRSDVQAEKYAALICYSHHRGLPSLPEELIRSENWLRDFSPEKRAHTDKNLDEYLRCHRECVGAEYPLTSPKLGTNRLQMLWRLALSCQADADHGDTSRHYGDLSLRDPPPLRASERLAALDRYVADLGRKSGETSRNELRRFMYDACRKADTQPKLYACDAPVGSGKTTAVMAHLLRAACDKGLRRIFVVLPYTNIIAQAVDVYRKALVIDGENPEEIVAELHHQADYAAPDSRQFAILWSAPIVVTTAVQFFETLAANMPSRLRKLHRLPGSAIFLDEAHAALPSHLWPQTWLWLSELAEHWGCHFVFASGSLSRFWELSDFHPEGTAQKLPPPKLPELVPDKLRRQALQLEKVRVVYKTESEAKDLGTLVRWISQYDGPRLLVLNTVQSAAVVAREIRRRFGEGRVQHLSTALTPVDKENTLKLVRKRLQNSSDSDWTLVATSCVEAGVDLSFRVGFRESAGLMSLIQLGGRVNRGHECEEGEIFDFQLKYDGLLRGHPKLKTSARVLADLFSEGKVDPKYCTEALRREIRWDDIRALNYAILNAEYTGDARKANFPRVAELFKVIDANTVTVIVAPHLQELLKRGHWCCKRELQKHSVQIWGWQVENLELLEFSHFPGLYGWQYEYSDFLGYMEGLLPVIEFSAGTPTVI
jgi:CRISPR-associated endonuclease/helicase Cas3